MIKGDGWSMKKKQDLDSASYRKENFLRGSQFPEREGNIAGASEFVGI
jgi:hypothetical protein